MNELNEWYIQYKALLFSLAYQLTGSVADAEDAVQDVFLKVQGVQPAKLQEPKAYLCKMVTNRCLDLLKSARKRREHYVGPWLPEPLPATYDDSSFEAVVRQELLSYAMLALLERLTPAERAVFVLREALCFDYPAIAELTEKSEANCRKLMSRARSKMGISEEELAAPGGAAEAWIEKFLAALSHGETETVLSMLHDDVVLFSDGGGKVSAATRPVESSMRVASFLIGIMRKEGGEADFELANVNGQSSIVIREQGHVIAVAFLQMIDNKVKSVYFVRNPDKLQHMKGRN
ncbi:RNA polymerase sigma-70 factor [Paenibacillus sp. GCM10027626]|uniref:RNA polymerase sigma-70 factor n=1 Tax=Paenibacillus sp. GCM10027626 TaxID=3273411 RepID=UPI003627EC82